MCGKAKLIEIEIKLFCGFFFHDLWKISIFRGFNKIAIN
jgi:hypothetical protein